MKLVSQGAAIAAIAIGLACGGGGGGGGGDGDEPPSPEWQVVSSNDEAGALLTQVTFGAGTFVALHSDLLGADEHGSALSISSSSDGSSWTPVSAALGEHMTELYGLAFGADVFVVAGANGYILTSADGRSWTPAVSMAAYRIGQAAYYVHFSGVAYANGTFMAVGTTYAPGAPNVYVTSADGSAWSEAQLLPEGLGIESGGLGVASLGDSFAVFRGSRVGFTVDGSSWRLARPFASSGFVALRGLAAGNGMYVAGGDAGGRIAVSRDLVSWNVTALVPGASLQAVDSVTFAGGIFVVTAGPTILTSGDAARWASSTIPGAAGMWGAAVGNGVYLVTGAPGLTVRAPEVEP